MKRRGHDYADAKFDEIYDRNSVNILEIVSGLKKEVWEQAYKEFRETHDLKAVQSDFSDLLTILLVAEDKAFPQHMPRIEAMAYLAQIYLMIAAFFSRYGNPEKEPAK